MKRIERARNPLSYRTIAEKEVNGVKYHYDIWEKDFTRTVFFTVVKMGDGILINHKAVVGGKINVPIKFNYRAVHNKKVVIESPQEYPEFIDEEEGLPKIETKTGIQTKIEHFNPELTVQVKINPKNWGKLKRVMRRKVRMVEVPKIISEDDWKEILGSQQDSWEKLTDEDRFFLTTKTDVELHKWLIKIFEEGTKADIEKYGNRIQILYSLPDTETKPEYYYEPVQQNKKTGILKNVDIDIEVIGEDYIHTVHINKGGVVKDCETNVLYNYYTFRIPVLPFICDWFNVPLPKEEKPKHQRKDLRKIIKNKIRR